MVFHRTLPLRLPQGRLEILCRFFTGFWAAWQTRAAWRRSLHDLRDLDDRLLADVGLSRADQRRGHPGNDL